MSHNKYGLQTVATLTLRAVPMQWEGSFGTCDAGAHVSTMTLHRVDDAGVISYSIEWDIPSLGETEHIGLELEGDKHIIGYDGVMSFPRPAKPWLESLGFTFDEDVE